MSCRRSYYECDVHFGTMALNLCLSMEVDSFFLCCKGICRWKKGRMRVKWVVVAMAPLVITCVLLACFLPHWDGTYNQSFNRIIDNSQCPQMIHNNSACYLFIYDNWPWWQLTMVMEAEVSLGTNIRPIVAHHYTIVSTLGSFDTYMSSCQIID